MAAGRRGAPPKKINKNTLKRLLKYVFKYYKFQLLLVFFCLILTACGGLVSSIFMQKNIDEVMQPGRINDLASVKDVLIKNITIMIVAYAIAVLASFAYNRIMASVTQGMLYHIRKDMFEKMQSLPIKYFDQHPHGEIMSTYTNDTDAVRQLIGQSLPTILSSIMTLAVAVFLMLYYSIILTLVFVICSLSMFFVVKKVGGKSAKHMVAQQISLAKEEGFVQENINGQKVVKVFTHEQDAEKDFDKLNEKLFEDAKEAHISGNILGPIVGNIGNFSYVFLALVGGILF